MRNVGYKLALGCKSRSQVIEVALELLRGRELEEAYGLVEGEYQVSQFRGDDRILSPTFPGLTLTAKQIFRAGSRG